MKKIILLILFVTLSFNVFSLTSKSDSEISLYNEINSYFKTQYYPGVVERTEQLEFNYPESVFIRPALILKAEALIKLNQFEKAEATCLSVLPAMHTGSEDFDKCYFLLGKADYFQEKYTSAISAFHKACSVAKTEKNDLIYNSAVLYAGRSFFVTNEYSEVVPLFEYVIANGKSYSLEDYEEALQKLFISYSETQNYEKSVALFEKLSPENFSSPVFTIVSLYAAEAYDKSQRPVQAYNLYSNLIDNENTNIGVTALKKAYVISSQNNIDVEPAAVLEKINNAKINPDNVLAEFWTRLGIDSYNQKDYQKAEECFKYAKEKSIDYLNLIIRLYEAKIQLDITPENKKASVAIDVESKLNDLESKIKESEVYNIQDSFYSVMLYTKACKQDWKAVPGLFEKITNPDSQVYYLAASSYYRYGNYKLAEEIIQKDLSTVENRCLYASILSKEGKFTEAQSIYSKLDTQNQLDDFNRIEFAKVLCQQKKWNDAKKQAKNANHQLSSYLLGIAEFNSGNYSEAKNHFLDYVKISKDGDDNKSMSIFYTAFSDYKMSNYQEAYENFCLYTKAYGNNKKMVCRAYELSAKAAIMFSDYDKAINRAEELIKQYPAGIEKYNAATFCAQIYADSNNYKKAVETIAPFTNKNSEFVISALFQTAIIYEKAGEITAADSVFTSIYTTYPETPEAEEAMYRCGELFYSAKDYKKAEEKFTKYIYNYVDGNFAPAAYYFSGECSLFLNNYNRSIMQNTNLLSLYPDSVYAYGAGKNLLAAYYSMENYLEALKVAKNLVNKYHAQAVSDGITDKARELEQIVSGTDRKIVEKNSEFEKYGKFETKKGRIAGSELVKLYADLETEEGEKKSFELANELLAKQTASDELLYAAENADFLANYYRNKEQNQKAAEMYLKAAEYYRTSGAEESQKAASSLYSAAEAFMAAELKGDAQATAQLLIKLYPESKQAGRVRSIVK